MAISYMDTDGMEEISRGILSSVDDLDTLINNLYKRLADVPNGSKEWVGGKAEIYFNRVAEDKQQYIDFSNKLREIGNKISSDAHSTQARIDQNNNIGAQ